jgi:hypothetical protein
MDFIAFLYRGVACLENTHMGVDPSKNDLLSFVTTNPSFLLLLSYDHTTPPPILPVKCLPVGRWGKEKGGRNFDVEF